MKATCEPLDERAPRVRTCRTLDRGWQFLRGRGSPRWLGTAPDAGGMDGAETVDLPHCWNATEAFRFGVSYYQGFGSYRVAFHLTPAELDGEAVWRLEAEGFYGLARVWLNGHRVAELDGQYLGFWLDVGRWLAPGRNVLGVRMDNRTRRDLLPAHKDPDFLLYGGFSGTVRLWRIDPLHLRARRLQLLSDLEDPRRAAVTLRVPVVNESSRERRFRLRARILSAGGETVAEGASEPARLASGGPHAVRIELEVPSPHLWSPDDPYLYRAVARLEEDGEVCDRIELPVGLRRAEFRRGEGFFLNGERLHLHGCNRHASMPGFGHALPPELHRRDAEILKELGGNLVRLSHYPQHPAFLDACDELGLLVYAEVASWKTAGRGRWLRLAKRQLEALILRDRNRPSVLVWGLGSEQRSRQAYLELRELARRLDPGRPVSYAENHHYRARRKKTLGIPDVWGVNYELDVLEEARDAARLGVVLMTECMNPYVPPGSGDLEARQVQAMETEYEALKDKPWVAGYAVWCFADYATMHRSRVRRCAGLLDAWRRAKPAADLFRARHGDGPFIALHGDWGHHPRAAPSRTIHLFTNCQRTELRSDGELVAEVLERPHAALEVPFRASDLEAVGWRADGERVEVRLPVHGDAEALRLHFDRLPRRPGEKRTVTVEVEVVDRRGVLVGCWCGTARLSLSGPGLLRAYTPEGDVELTRGRGRCFFTPSGHAGVVEVEAVAPGLASASAELRVEGEPR